MRPNGTVPPQAASSRHEQERNPMPTLRELQSRFPKSHSAVMKIGDEVLVADARARKTPCNFVEDKFLPPFQQPLATPIFEVSWRPCDAESPW